jgi:hypothetical protein
MCRRRQRGADGGSAATIHRFVVLHERWSEPVVGCVARIQPAAGALAVDAWPPRGSTSAHRAKASRISCRLPGPPWPLKTSASTVQRSQSSGERSIRTASNGRPASAVSARSIRTAHPGLSSVSMVAPKLCSQSPSQFRAYQASSARRGDMALDSPRNLATPGWPHPAYRRRFMDVRRWHGLPGALVIVGAALAIKPLRHLPAGWSARVHLGDVGHVRSDSTVGAAAEHRMRSLGIGSRFQQCDDCPLG